MTTEPPDSGLAIGGFAARFRPRRNFYPTIPSCNADAK